MAAIDQWEREQIDAAIKAGRVRRYSGAEASAAIEARLKKRSDKMKHHRANGAKSISRQLSGRNK